MLVVVTFSTRQMYLVVVPGRLNLPHYLTVAVMAALTVYCVICTACLSYLRDQDVLDIWTLEDESDTLSRNISYKPIYSAQQLVRGSISRRERICF